MKNTTARLAILSPELSDEEYEALHRKLATAEARQNVDAALKRPPATWFSVIADVQSNRGVGA